MSNEDLAKQKYLETQLILQQVKQTNQHLEILQNQLVATISLVEHLDDLAKIPKNTKIYTALGPGVFVEAELKNTDRVLLTIGAQTAVYKTVEETKKALTKQTTDIHELMSKISADLQKLTTKSETLQQELRDLIGND